MAQTLKLNTKPKLVRFGRAMLAEAVPVEMPTTPNTFGVIKGVSVITKGEALGHCAWIDDEMLSQVNAAFANAPKGIKSRFTHPGRCSDGLGKHLGRVTNAQVKGSSVVGDLNFAKSAYSSPEGNLAQYVIDLVNDDPAAAGLSIAFDRDYKAEMEFALANGASVEEDADGCPYLDMSGFKSPDPTNFNNYPHVRLAELRAVDVVDEPAANPNGMFDSNPVARDADKALAYMLGLSKDKPAELLFGVNVDRASEFVTRFLANRKLKIVELNTETAPEVKPEPAQVPVPDGSGKNALLSRDDFNKELGKYVAKFGAEHGTQWFTQGKSFVEALELHVEQLGKDKASLADQVKTLNERLSAISIGTDPLPIAGLSADKPRPKTISEAVSLASQTK